MSMWQNNIFAEKALEYTGKINSTNREGAVIKTRKQVHR